MEGVTDAHLRNLIGRMGIFDYGVTEFFRVTDHPIPVHVFERDFPEGKNGGVTESGLPIQVQILGGNAERMGQSALNAIRAGARAVDINFGCPAPTVNRNDGGATLLKYPERIEQIIAAVRAAVPVEFPVSAKLRLGFDDPSVIDHNAKRAEAGGANWITIHGRTKLQGYTPPAYWEPIGRVRRALTIPVIANGEIWNVDELKKCIAQSGCDHFMMGRTFLANPGEAQQVRGFLNLSEKSRTLAIPTTAMGADWLPVFELMQDRIRKIKMWSRYIATRQDPEWWEPLKKCQTWEEMKSLLGPTL